MAAATAAILYVGLGGEKSGIAEKESEPVRTMPAKATAKPTPVIEAESPSPTPAQIDAPKAVQNSRFFDLENDSIVDAKCNVTIDGAPVIRGGCTVNTKDRRAIVFSNEDGCTIDINGNGTTGIAELTAYRDLCPALDGGPDPLTQLSLGNVTRRGDCWISDRVTICARA